jgi:hypothetical protein
MRKQRSVKESEAKGSGGPGKESTLARGRLGGKGFRGSRK